MPFGGENAESYYDEGLTASVKGDIEQAIRCFERVLQLDPSSIPATHQLAKCYMRIRLGSRAVALLRKVLAHKPNQASALIDLAYAELSTGNHKEAKAHFTEAVTLEPTNARAHLGLGHVSYELGDWQAAVAQSLAARAYGGPSFGVLFLLGRATKLTGDATLSKNALEEADGPLEKTLEIKPDQPECHYLRGEICFVREQYVAALEHYQAAEVRTDPRRVYSAFGESFMLVDVLAKEGLCFLQLGNPGRAHELGKRILQMDPNYRLARSLLEQEQG